ncbi:MAG TPA: signal peptidase II [Asticcacaulis sp.]|nr:signal peptidase II [Asticcacaulis sp.]
MSDYIRRARDFAQGVIAAPVSRFGLISVAIFILVIVVDQASKAWVLYGLRLPSHPPVKILPFFSFSYVENTGMSFGILSGTWFGRWFLTLFQLAAAVCLGYGATKAKQPLPAIALSMIAGGAIGNAVDRIRFGSVVDFLDFSGTHVFPWVFNVADSAISIGVALLAWHFIRTDTADGQKAQDGAA